MTSRALPVARLTRRVVRWAGALALVLATPMAVAAQDSAAVTLGAEHAASHGLLGLGGRGWRAAWGAPLRLPVLTPADLGGGLRSVEIEAGPLAGVVIGRGEADGLVRRVLPVDLDPITAILPPDARKSGLPSFLRDLVATLHPTAPLVAGSLYRSAGLPVLDRTLGVVPADGAGLPHGAVPPGAAAWVERAPELDGRPWQGFSYVIGTDSLLARQREVAGTRIDLRAYLAARLTDVVLGDRNRAPLAWLWGWDVERGLWVPIGRWQEQAMLRAGSSSRLLLGAYQPGFVSFGAQVPHTQALTARAWDLDRPWLALLDRATWDSVATALQARLDDAAIQRAVDALPVEHRRLAGAEIAAALRYRRDALPKVVDAYYSLMAHYADLDLTGLADSVFVQRGPDGSLDLAVQREGSREALRRFSHDETAEVRLHLGAGADRLVLENVERGGVGLRVTGGPGADTVVRLRSSASRVVLYDERAGVVRTPEDAVRLVPHEAARQQRWATPTSPPPPDFGARHSPRMVLGYNSDLSLYLGAGVQWKWYGFAEPFYRQRLTASLAYAFGPGSFRGAAAFERRNVLRDVHLSAEVLASGIEVVRYHGLGNETVDTASGAFYRAVNKELTGRLMVGLSRDPALELKVGPVITLLSTDTTGTESLVALEDPYGSGDFQVAGVEASFRYRPDRSYFAEGLGVVVSVQGQFHPAVLDAVEAFGGVSGEVDATWVPRLGGRLVVATRLGGSVLGGRVPFARAARVGGPRTLRGFAVDRFAGDRGSAYGSLELRSRLTRFRLGIAPGDLGILVFGSGGRVWQGGEESGTVHWAGGGGLWVAPSINWLPGLDDVVGRFEVAHSDEGTFFYFGTGFRF